MSKSLKKLLTEFKYLEHNSANVKNNSLFLAYPGSNNDGRQYIGEAIKNGASAIFYDPSDFKWDNQWNLPNLAINKLKDNVSMIASEFYNHPSHKINLIGVTGTNGKTSTVFWITQCLEKLKRKATMISTIGYGFRDNLKPTVNTTPDAIKIQSFLNDFVLDKVQDSCIEVSSHGIDQKRVSGIDFDVRLFTNFSRDHLDYHNSIESYAQTKKNFLLEASKGKLVINLDDPLGKLIYAESKLTKSNKISYGIESECLIKAKNIKKENKTTKFDLIYKNKIFKIEASVEGNYNVYNILAVIGTLVSFGYQIEDIKPLLKTLDSVPGRGEVLNTNLKCPTIIIDYAHTPDALDNILRAFKSPKNKRLKIVFGCGGDRDKGKRKEMAKIVNKYADFAIVTSDNPRNENPKKIISDICQNLIVPNKAIEEREAAIILVIETADINDLILIAGKGHETYQEIKGKRKNFSDKLIAKKYIAKFFGAKN